ncbi:alanine racemase [Nocardioides sp. LHD-245]|uniref:alanine racemase n=1 Tax=Nocardioides sp. LHD-245 TaxID=3051387 RepID=UPI0027E0B095|nr:alanine racemase [Nocardioides sp. LHD-245]
MIVGAEDLVCPYLVVDDDALTHNIAAMARWCGERGVAIAPHAKTTMAPYVLRAQLAAGAWGLTVATVAQARAVRALADVPLMIANQVVGAPEQTWLAGAPGEVLSWVDSVAQVDALAAAAEGRARPLDVLVEVGLSGGRAGTRRPDQARALAQSVLMSRHLRLRGIAAYEGSYGTGPDPLASVDRFLDRVEDVIRRIDADGAFADERQVLVTAGGSLYFDRCVRLHALELAGGRSTSLLLRSGCYALHDDGLYARTTPHARGVPDAPPLRSAVAVVARVQSRPEAGLVILGAGRRDLAYDQDLPVLLSCRGGAVPVRGMSVDRLDDQHAYVRVPEESAVAVGDTVELGISHPCSVLDRWRTFQLVRGGRIVRVEETWFP